MAAWSSRLNQALARPSGRAWYRVDTPYSRIIVPAKRLAPTTAAALCRAALQTRIGSEAMASSRPRPWLSAFMISSATVCSRSATRMAGSSGGRALDHRHRRADQRRHLGHVARHDQGRLRLVGHPAEGLQRFLGHLELDRGMAAG